MCRGLYAGTTDMDNLDRTHLVKHLDLIEHMVELSHKKIKTLRKLGRALIHEQMKQETFTLSDIFSMNELRKVKNLWVLKRDSFHTEVMKLLTDEKLVSLKAKGLEFDRSYLAYAVEYLMTVWRH